MNDVTISVPTFPEPEYAAKYRRGYGGGDTDATRPVLRVEVYETKDGYGIAGEDMVPGRSITIRADKDYQARLTYLLKDKPEYPLFIHIHDRNTGQTHIAWVLPDGSERGGNLSHGKTVDLRDFWADAWIIEGKQ